MTNLSHDTANDTRLADANKLLRKLGVESAHSALAKPKMALAIVQARADGVIDDDAGASTYDTYLEGRRSVLAKSQLGAGAEDAGGSYKSNVSKNTQLIKAAALPDVDFVDILTRATAIREGLIKADEKCKPVFDAYVDLARAQIKQPDTSLGDDEITEVVRKKEAAEKDAIAKLVDTYKRVYKQAEEYKLEPLLAAVQSVGEAIAELGGEVPAMTKEEKERVSAMAYIARMGFQVTAADHASQ